MKIAIIHMGFFYSGGGERTVLNEAIGLQKRGHYVDIFCPTLSNNCFPELMKQVNIREMFWWLPKSLQFRNAIGMVLTSIRSTNLVKYFKNYDVILAHSQPSNWLAFQIKKKYGVPYVSYLHQVNRFLYPRRIDKIMGWNTSMDMILLSSLHKFNNIIKRMDKISIENANLVLSNSNWTRSKINDVYNVDSIVCHPGVNSIFMGLYNYGKNNERYVLSTNRHYPQKRLDYLIYIMSLVVKYYPDVKCIITGSFTRYTYYLMNLVKNFHLEKNIIFTNYLSEKDLLMRYRKAYLYAYTSPEEDFGLGPIEAGACGVPSVVWDYAGPRETVINGETGFRVSPYDLDEFADKIIKVFSDRSLREKLGWRALRFVKENFSLDKHISILESALYSAIN